MGKDTGDTQEQEKQFSDEDQKFIDKLIGKVRIEAREKGKADAKTEQEAATADAERKELAASAEFEKLAQMHADRVGELEALLATAGPKAKAADELVSGMLKDRIKALGDKAKVIVKAMPESLSDLEKLNWLNAVEEQFVTEGPTGRVGTPARKKKLRQDTGKPVESVLGKGKRFRA